MGKDSGYKKVGILARRRRVGRRSIGESQRDVIEALHIIYTLHRHLGRPAHRQEIAEAIGLKSLASMHARAERMRRLGVIDYDVGTRGSLHLTALGRACLSRCPRCGHGGVDPDQTLVDGQGAISRVAWSAAVRGEDGEPLHKCRVLTGGTLCDRPLDEAEESLRPKPPAPVEPPSSIEEEARREDEEAGTGLGEGAAAALGIEIVG